MFTGETKENESLKMISSRPLTEFWKISLCMEVVTERNCTFLYHSPAFSPPFIKMRDQSGRVVKGMKCLRPLEHRDRGFESQSRYECLSAFLL
jgi:hypothetical protein